MYSQVKVLAGGLAHIPVIIGVFYLVLTFFNKRALKFPQDTKGKKLDSKVAVVVNCAASLLVPPGNFSIVCSIVL